MASHKVILDCDPGQDDAVNLLLAMSSPAEIDILGITAVAGNVPLELTQRNCRIICELAGRSDIRVFAGDASPLVRPLVTAEHVHGSTGIDGIDVYEPEHPLEAQHAVDFIIETMLRMPADSVTLVPTGPLTNIAQAFLQAPDIIPRVREIVLMGGAMREGGNITPSAEFNVFVDPHAAATVFDCGRPITAFGLDVTHQVLTTRERAERIRALDNPVARAVVGMLDYFDRYDSLKYGSKGAPLHDPCTLAWLLAPQIFAGKSCNISIETESGLTMGSTVVDYWRVTERPQNATWIDTVDDNAFYDLLTERLGRFPGVCS